MRNLLFVFFVCVSSSYAQKMKPEKFEYVKDVEFSVVNFQRSRTAQYGNGNDNTMYIAPKGHRFVTAIMKFYNNSTEDVIIDFKEIQIVDQSDKRYEVDGVLQNLKLTNTSEKYKLKLKAGKSKTYIVEFWAALPKDEIVRKMIVAGEMIYLEPEN